MGKNIVWILCVLFSFQFVLASEGYQQDRDVIERAKSKKYINGNEEGELRVQPQVLKPQRKIAPVIDKKETETNLERD